MDDDSPAIPCGLVAKSFFNDTFVLQHGDGTPIDPRIDETNIAWPSDRDYSYQNMVNNLPPNKTWEDVQWIDLRNGKFFFVFGLLISIFADLEHLMVWMRTAGLTTFRKLWGKIAQGLDSGDYQIEIDNQFNVAPFSGKKSFVLTTANALGGKNFFMSQCYIVVGTFCMLFALIFMIAHLR